MAVPDATPALGLLPTSSVPFGKCRLPSLKVCLLVAYPRIRLSSCEARHPSAGDSSDNLIRVRTAAIPHRLPLRNIS